MTTVAMLLSCDSFESFYGKILRLDRARYLESYRNDWSWYYAKGLLENGQRPIIYMPSLYESGLFETDAGISVRFLPCARWYEPLARMRRAFRATRWSLYIQERLNAMAFYPALHAAMIEDGVSVLFNQEYWNGRFDHIISRVRVPVTAIDQGGLPSGVFKAFKRSAFAKASRLYCQTLDEREHVHVYGGRTELQPNGVDADYFRPLAEAPLREKTIITVARLTDKQKRTSDLIRAMKHLDRDWKLKIVGTGPDREMLEQLARDQGVAGRVEFLGFRGRDEVRSLNQHCGVYAMPSSNEGVCLAMLEAMACGAAVVATKIRAFETLVEDGVNGLLVPVGDPHALAAAISNAWRRRDELGANAVTRIQDHFNAKSLYRRLAQMLASIAEGDGSSGPPADRSERLSMGVLPNLATIGGVE